MDKVIWLGCLLLIFLGVGFGFALGSDLNSRDSFKYALEVGSFIATIAAAVVATVTLTAWRQQFKFGKSHEALSRLAGASIGLNTVRKYVRNVGYQHVNDLAGDYRVETPDLEVEAKEATVAWYRAFSEYNAAFEEVSMLVVDPDIGSLMVANEDISSYPLNAILKIINTASSNESTARQTAIAELSHADIDLKELISIIKDLVRKIRSRHLAH